VQPDAEEARPGVDLTGRVSADGLEAAVGRVLPALNLQPDDFVLDLGFVRRVRGRDTPTAIALARMSRQRVVMPAAAMLAPADVAAREGR
jgi:hypothetical protein